MTNYSEQFKLFNLPDQSSFVYEDANTFARTFERCSIQTRENITYSTGTSLLLSNETSNIVKSPNTNAI